MFRNALEKLQRCRKIYVAIDRLRIDCALGVEANPQETMWWVGLQGGHLDGFPAFLGQTLRLYHECSEILTTSLQVAQK